MLAWFLAVQASATHADAAIWRGTRDPPASVAPAAWSDGDPRTFAELDPGDARAEVRIGLLFPVARPLAALEVDFLSLYEHVFEGSADASALELLGPDGWCPVAATLTRDLSRRGELARHEEFGGVVWRLAFPRCEARGARLVLRRTADERAPWRRYVVREIAITDDPAVAPRPIEGDAIGRTLAQSLEAARAAARSELSEDAVEATLDLALPEHGATRSFDGEGVVIAWPRPRFVGEVEVGDALRPDIEWWDGGQWRPVIKSGRDFGARLGRNRRGETPAPVITRFLPVATAQLRVLGIEEETTVNVRLGSDAQEDVTRVATSGRDLLLERTLDLYEQPDFGVVASALLPLAANAALLGRPDDPVETLVTWNGTLHETEHGDEGAWNNGAPGAGGGRERWIDRWCAFTLEDELVGADPDRVARKTFARGRPGVVTTATHEGLELTIAAYVTAPGSDPWASAVTLRVVNESETPRVARVAALLGRRKSAHAAQGELDLAPLPTGHAVRPGDDHSVRDAAGALVLYTPDAATITLAPCETQVAFAAPLAAGEAREFRLLLPSVNAPTSEVAALASFDFTAARARFDQFWDAQLSTFELSLPEAPFDRLVPSLLAQCHIALFDEVPAESPPAGASAKPGDPPSLRLKYGAYAYEDYFGLEEAWPALALAQFGQFEAAQRAAERMVAADLLDPANYHHQYRMGVAATTAVRVFALTRDEGFHARIAPRLDAIADWIVAARHQEDGSGGAYEGLLPKHTYGGDITTPARSLYANAACWRGLHEIALLLKERGDARADAIASEAFALRARITAVADAAVERDHEPPFVPMAVDLGDGGREPAYDFLPADPLGNYWSLFAPLLLETGVFPPQSELSEWIRAMRVDRGGALCLLARFHRGVDPVYGLGGTLALADADDARGFVAGAYGYFAHALDRDVFTGGEVQGVFPLRTSNLALTRRLAETRWQWNLYFGDGMADEAGRATGSEPLSASAGVGLELVRRMLVEELPDRAERAAGLTVAAAAPRSLQLLRLAPPHWLEDGKTIHLRLPTEFGVVALTVESHVQDGHVDGRVELLPAAPGSTAAPVPAQIVLWINHPGDIAIERVKVDGALHGDFQDSCILLAPDGAHTFRVDY